MNCRRLTLTAAALVAAVTVTACSGAAPRDHATTGTDTRSALRSAVTTEISGLAAAAGAEIGVYGVALDDHGLATGAPLEVSADTRFPVLSMFKVYAAADILDTARAGRLDLDGRVPVVAADVVANSPITGTRVGREMSYAEIAMAALQYSDNTAGNLMLRALGGPSAITAFARSVGDSATDLVRTETSLNTAIPGDRRDTTTPRQFATGLRALLTGDRLDASDRTTLVTWMRGSTTSAARFRAQLPTGWTTADKTGGGDNGATNDGGILFAPGGKRILLVVQTRDRPDRLVGELHGDLVAAAARVVADRLDPAP